MTSKQANQPAQEPGKIHINLEEIKKNKFFIATPCYGGGLMEPYFKSILRTVFFCDRNGINLQFGTVANESLVTRARNTLVAFFMKSDCTHLLFIDADIEFKLEDFLRLAHANKDVVTGAYPKKGLNWEAIRQAAVNGKPADALKQAGADYAMNFKFDDPVARTIRIENGLIEVKDAGTGFMMIKREVIEKMMKAHPDLQYNNDLNLDKALDEFSYALFDTMIDGEARRYLSEDYTFCRRWQNMGGQIWLDPAIQLTHYGTTGFFGNPMAMFEPNT